MTKTAPTPIRSISAHHRPGTITRHHQLGADFTIVVRDGLEELHLTLQPGPGESPTMLLLRLDTILREHRASVVRMEVFGARKDESTFRAMMRGLLGGAALPITWIDGAGFNGQSIAGLHVIALIGTPVQSLTLDDRVVGATFQDAYARHCVLSGVLPTHLRATRARQSREVFENMGRALTKARMEPRHIARTWLYLDDLLAWYGELNRERTQIFREWDLFTTGVPASTGIGAANPHGAAMIAGAWATVCLDPNASVREVVSPLQCPAGSYGSSFARAMEWSAPDHRRLTISGTASIDPGGRSAHPGDIRAQVDLTMEVVEAILDSRRMSFGDVTRATAYIKHPQDADCLEEWFERTGTAWFAAIPTHTQVCRDELLFEIELDAITHA